MVLIHTVAVQCLEQVFGVDRSDPAQVAQFRTEQSLQEIYNNATKVRDITH